MRLEIQIGDFGSEKHRTSVARNLETLQPKFLKRVYHDDFPASSLEFHKKSHKSRMVARRIGADKNYKVRTPNVFEVDRACAAAEALAESDSRSLVAIVGAVINIVRTPLPGDKLN